MLRLTVDCDAETLRAVTGLLERGRRAGVLHYGLWTQPAALMTCIVPSALQRDHMHFLDGRRRRLCPAPPAS